MMKRTRFSNLYWKISAVFFLMLMFVGMVYVKIAESNSNMFFEEVNQRLNKNTAFDIVKHAQPFVDGKVNDHAMKVMFDQIMSINPSMEVYLLNNDGDVLTFYAPEKKIALTKIDVRPIHQYLSHGGSQYIKGDDPRHPEIRKVFSVAPIITNGKQQGYIYIVLSGEQYNAASDSLRSSFVFKLGLRTMLVTLLATLITGLFIIRVLTKNFSRMIDVMKKFREGDMAARVAVTNTGDVNELAAIFNEMADILTQNIEKLQSVETLRRELIANVSHDLRTPVSIIHGYLETLQMKADTLSAGERERYLSIIMERTHSLETLIEELFELSKLEANQVKPSLEPLNISELVNDMSNQYKLIADKKGITIWTDLQKELPLVLADVSLMERVMQNLMDNAFKFTLESGTIHIETKSLDGRVKIAITDTGIGISSEERDKVFGRYYKGNPVSHTKSNTGLGLAIVKKILELHHAELELISEKGAGSSFIIYLPVYKE